MDELVRAIKARHIARLQAGSCSIEYGFVLDDLLTNYERVCDHCSNVAVAQIEVAQDSFDTHAYLNDLRQRQRLPRRAKNSSAVWTATVSGIMFPENETRLAEEKRVMIYIVEDDASIRELEQYALQSSGYRGAAASPAPEPFWQAMRARPSRNL